MIIVKDLRVENVFVEKPVLKGDITGVDVWGTEVNVFISSGYQLQMSTHELTAIDDAVAKAVKGRSG